MLNSFDILERINKLKFSINSDILKIIAIVSMTIDHLVKGMDFEYTTLISNSIGRIAFPIFGFLIALNLARFARESRNSYNGNTNSVLMCKKYLIRLLIFGTITFYLDYLTAGKTQYNIMFTFFLSVLFVYISEFIHKQNFSDIQKILFTSVTILWFTQVSFIMEYGTQGFLYIVLFYYFLVYKKNHFLIMLLLSAFFLNSGTISIFVTLITTFLLLLIKEQSFAKRILMRKWWFFYAYYPVHKAVINLIF